MQLNDGLNNAENKTNLWLQSPQSTKYVLPKICPECNSKLQTDYVYLGIFPYLHVGVNLKCQFKHEFTFCLPYNRAMNQGIQIFDTKENPRFNTEKTCPFDHGKLVAIRLYGDLVFTDGTMKMQLHCPTCNYSVRVTFKKF